MHRLAKFFVLWSYGYESQGRGRVQSKNWHEIRNLGTPTSIFKTALNSKIGLKNVFLWSFDAVLKIFPGVPDFFEHIADDQRKELYKMVCPFLGQLKLEKRGQNFEGTRKIEVGTSKFFLPPGYTRPWDWEFFRMCYP